MAKARVEFANLTASGNINIIRSMFQTAYEIDTEASPPDDDPECPAGFGHAIISAVEGNLIVDWGASPSPSATRGHLIFEGSVEAIKVNAGHTISIVEAA